MEDYCCYTPFLVTDQCAVRGDVEWQPSSLVFDGAVCFCDVSGFTALTERLQKEGKDGAEQLVSFLNLYFDQLVSLIVAHGGDVIKFAGDAVLTIFQRGEDESMASTVQRSCEAAWAIMEAMNGSEDQPRLHIGIGAGRMAFLEVGGGFGRCEYLVVGAPLCGLGPAVTAASPDFTVLSADAWELVKDACEGEELDGGLVKLTGITAPLPAHVPKDMKAVRAGYPPHVARNLSLFVPGAVRRVVDKGNASWIAELRTATVLFINITGLDLASVEEASSPCLEAVNNVIVLIQKALYRYEGSVNKVLLDDKGFVVLGAFGLPPLSHPDDSARGVLTAMLAEAALKEAGVACTIGISTGKVFCGVVGSAVRREYTVMGDVVNTAARIMCAHVEGAPVLCDQATKDAAVKVSKISGRKLDFRLAATKKFKGKKDDMDVYAPSLPEDVPSTPKMKGLTTMARVNVNLCGRTREIMLLQAVISELVEGGDAQIVILEGERGMGKSRLLEEGKVIASSESTLDIYACVGDSLDSSTPYRAWQAMFVQLLALTPTMSGEEIEERIDMHLETADPHLACLSPLLGPVLGVQLDDNATTGSMSSAERCTRMREAMLGFLQFFTKDMRVVLFAQDYHFFDLASKSLLLAWSRERTKDMVMVVSTRPFSRGEDAIFSMLREAENATSTRLAGLERNALRKLMCQRLDVDDVPEVMATAVVKRCGGNPFFAQELAYAMVKEGYVTVNGRTCALAAGVFSAEDVTLPDTMNGVVTGRLDRLPPNYLHTIKVASALGAEFDVDTLHAIFPTQETSGSGHRKGGRIPRTTLLSDLHFLEQDDFLERVDESEEVFLAGSQGHTAMFAFKNQFIQTCAYSLMLYTQRANLHQRIAEYYENLSPKEAYITLVAYHWRKADVRKPEVAARAIGSLHDAAVLALEHGDRAEAVPLLHEALWLCTSETDPALVASLTKMLKDNDAVDKSSNINLSPAAVADASAHFEAFDTDGNGSLDEAEVLAVLQKLGADVELGHVRDIMAEASLRTEGIVALDEFLMLVSASQDDSGGGGAIDLATAMGASVHDLDLEGDEKTEGVDNEKAAGGDSKEKKKKCIVQ